MKDDFFDPDLEPDASVLSVSATEETAVATDTTETPPADNGRKKRQIMGYDLSTLLIAGTAFIALVGYALWPDTPTQQAFIPDNTSQSVAVQAPPTLPPESWQSLRPLRYRRQRYPRQMIRRCRTHSASTARPTAKQSQS